MKDVCETLFDPVSRDLLKIDGKRLLFLNAFAHPILHKHNFDLQQYFKPYADAAGAKPEISTEKEYDVIFYLFPKNMIEGRYQMASALRQLQDSGVLVCAADNKSGGSRLKKLFLDFGLSDVQEISKNKARVVWGIKNETYSSDVIETDAKQTILDGLYVSQPGIFGWDKIDRGSQILVQYLPSDLQGRGADFGCGYGYLARQVLESCENIKSLMCIDADYRAVTVCKENLEAFESRTSFYWSDLTQKQDNLKNLDFIIMNPPFHEGRKTDIGVGKLFIEQAAIALRKGGKLWMVANTHLPYEKELSLYFTQVSMLWQGQGFKVYCAVKG